MNHHRPLLACGATAATLAICATAGTAGAAAPTIANGFYSSLEGHPSADVEFHVRRKGTFVSDLAVTCQPTVPVLSLDSGYDFIAVKPLRPLTIRHGQLTYHGAAIVPKEYEPPTGARTTMSLSLRHVNGPVVHYTFEGEHHTETRRWVGTVSSAACSSIADHGKVSLWGPVPGE